MAITLIIIHPKELLRLGLQSVFKGQAGFKVVGQGSTGKEAQKLVKQHEPNLILLYDQLMTKTASTWQSSSKSPP
jgi:DNA-binding NarL/FixJ family response regulator